MICDKMKMYDIVTLHSNLVIFKWKPWQVHSSDLMNFTFQSGYIQIFISLNFQIHITALYIPIWLYSNKAKGQEENLMQMFFTFQSGYIQIIVKAATVPAKATFTFQSGYIQMCMVYKVKPTYAHFTFQSGYIQIRVL